MKSNQESLLGARQELMSLLNKRTSSSSFFTYQSFLVVLVLLPFTWLVSNYIINSFSGGYIEYVNGVSFEMVSIEGDTFQMGRDSGQTDVRPIHSVTLSGFNIGKTEVTQAQWRAVMGTNPSGFKGNDDRPVEKVSWEDCQLFITKLNRLTGKHYRLPTEAEWEYAAYGGKNRGETYSGSNNLGEVAWYEDNSDNKTHAVGQKKPNELGLYDMSGNVYEWCSDWFDESLYGRMPSSNPQEGSLGSSRICRGGSWNAHAQLCCSSVCTLIAPSDRYDFLGFRLVSQ